MDSGEAERCDMFLARAAELISDAPLVVPRKAAQANLEHAAELVAAGLLELGIARKEHGDELRARLDELERRARELRRALLAEGIVVPSLEEPN